MEYTAATGAHLSVGVMVTAVQETNQDFGVDIATNLNMHEDNFFAKQYILHIWTTNFSINI